MRFLLAIISLAVAHASPFSESLAFNTQLRDTLAALPTGAEPTLAETREKYLSLLSNSVIGLSEPNGEYSLVTDDNDDNHSGGVLLRVERLSEELRREGRDLPFIGISASGEKNLQRLRKVVEEMSNDLRNAPGGDVVSCAPFRGGTGVFLRGLLHSLVIYESTRVVVMGPPKSNNHVVTTGSKKKSDDAAAADSEMDELTEADVRLKESKRGAPSFNHTTTHIQDFLTLQSSSRLEMTTNFVSHLQLRPSSDEVAFQDLAGCLDTSPTLPSPTCVLSSKRKVSIVHIGPAVNEEVTQCLTVVKPLLSPTAVIMIDRCVGEGNRGCETALAAAGIKLVGDVEQLESGGVMGRVGEASSQARAGELRIANMQQTYLWLLKMSVLGNALVSSEFSYQWDSVGIANQTAHAYSASDRFQGRDWPWLGTTMVGEARLNQLQNLLTDVVEQEIEGDFVECGSWRGGASIYARGLLDDMGQQHRRVWVFDSFEGLPPNRTTYDELFWSKMDFLRVSPEEVWNNFRGHNLANKDNVILDKGFFVDSLPSAPIDKISILRMDGDMYESTLDTLYNLYGKLSMGGYVIVDDAPRVGPAERAIRDFCRVHGFEPNIVIVYDSVMGCHWQKTVEVPIIRREEYIKILTDPEHIKYQEYLMQKERSCVVGDTRAHCQKEL